MKSHQKFGRNSANPALLGGGDQPGPPLDGDRTSPLDVAPTGSGVFRIPARAAELCCPAKGFDEVIDRVQINVAHRPKLRTMRSQVNAHCVTQFAKSVDMEEVHERLAWARRHHGIYKTGTDAARAFGWTVSTYLGHENGDRKPSRELARRYADAYGVRWEWLLENEGQPTAPNIVRVMGRIGAGGAIDPDFEQIPPDGLFEIEVPVDIPQDAIAFEVSGESMWPRYDDGDVVICWKQGTNVREVIGWEAAVQTSDGKRYLKRILEGSTPRSFDLESYNAPVIRGVRLEWVSRVNLVVRRGEWKQVKKRTIARAIIRSK